MAINSGNPLNYGGGGNFDTHTDYRHDFFSVVQKMVEPIGSKGEKSDKFVERAYRQYWENDFVNLAEQQKSFIEDDMVNNTPGRGALNLRRMEYDNIAPLVNGKGAVPERKLALANGLIDAKNLIKSLDSIDWTLCSTASAISTAPITQEDYVGQINLRRTK